VTIRGANVNLGVPQCKNCWNYTRFKVQSVSSTMDHTNWKIIMNMASVVRPMRKQIYCASKPKKVIHACTFSSVLTAMAIIKQTLQYVRSGEITSIESGSRRSILKSMKTRSIQFIWL